MLRRETVHRYTIDEFGNVNVQRVERILEDDELLAERYHRHVVTPNDDDAGEAPETRAIVAVARSPERLARRPAAPGRP